MGRRKDKIEGEQNQAFLTLIKKEREAHAENAKDDEVLETKRQLMRETGARPHIWHLLVPTQPFCYLHGSRSRGRPQV